MTGIEYAKLRTRIVSSDELGDIWGGKETIVSIAFGGTDVYGEVNIITEPWIGPSYHTIYDIESIIRLIQKSSEVFDAGYIGIESITMTHVTYNLGWDLEG
jgi:hypothetical protein